MKKLLLITLFTLGVYSLTFSQAPPNDLIQNAILVDQSPYIQNNVRLDQATSNAGGQSGCDLAGFPVVYYKFTADSNVDMTITIEDSNNSALGQTIAIVYSAPNLNVTDESLLTAETACQIGDITTLSLSSGTNYYVLVHRSGGGSVYSRITIDIPQDVMPSERAALADLYNNTIGANWTVNTNWSSAEPASSWEGVVVKNGHVSQINLFNHNLVGTIPPSVSTGLPFLEQLNLRGNKLSGVVDDFSTISTLLILDIKNNDFSFQDLETNYANNTTISDFRYNTQNGRGAVESYDGIIGNDYSLFMSPVLGTNVQYQWYNKRYSYFIPSDDPVVGATSNTLNLLNLQEDDMDVYYCYATSPIITDLFIGRATIEIKGPISQSQRDALTAIYNSTNGDNWNNNTNWLSAEPISTWYGVRVAGNKVTQLDFTSNNLTGTLPHEIEDLIGLQNLTLYNGNNISGPIPPEIGNLTELRLLSLENNNFTGEIPASYANLTKLSGFWLTDNQLTGTIPEYLTTFPYLAFVDIGMNNFYGDLPDFTLLPELLYVNIANNHFYSEDFASEFDVYSNLRYGWENNSYYYSPQTTLDLPENRSLGVGSDIVLSASEYSDRHSSPNRVQQFQWYKNDVLIAGGTSNPYIITNAATSDSGSYHCVITDTAIPDFEIIRAPIIVDVSLGVNENELQNFQLYPNPTNGLVTIKASSTIEKITVYDVLGKILSEQTLENDVLDISSLQSGIYFIKLDSENESITKRIIKQ